MADKDSGEYSNPNAVLRWFEMLKFIPREPDGISVSKLEKKLSDAGFSVQRRTIERDLQTMKREFKGLVDIDWSRDPEDSRVKRWAYLPGSPTWVFPATDVTVYGPLLISKHFPLALPSYEWENAKGFESTAEQSMARRQNDVAQWIGKVLFCDPAFPIRKEKLQELCLSLYCSECAVVSIQKSLGQPTLTVELWVTGLVFDQGHWTVVGMEVNDEEMVHFPIHWILGSDESSFHEGGRKPKRKPIPLGAYWGSVQDEQNQGSKISIDLRIATNALNDLLINPIDAMQRVTSDEESSSHRLTASVRDSAALRRRLLGHGSNIEVIKPENLRRAVAREARQLAELYATPEAPASPAS